MVTNKLTTKKDRKPLELVDFGEHSKNFAHFLVGLFSGTDHAIVWSNDYSSKPRIAEEDGMGDRRYVCMFEVRGPSYLNRSKSVYSLLRLHTDSHVEVSSGPVFLEHFRESLDQYTGGNFCLSSFTSKHTPHNPQPSHQIPFHQPNPPDLQTHPTQPPQN